MYHKNGPALPKGNLFQHYVFSMSGKDIPLGGIYGPVSMPGKNCKFSKISS